MYEWINIIITLIPTPSLPQTTASTSTSYHQPIVTISFLLFILTFSYVVFLNEWMNEWFLWMKKLQQQLEVYVYKYIHASIENEWMEYEQNRKTGSTD